DAKKANEWYSVFAAGPGIIGVGSHVYSDDPFAAVLRPGEKDLWNISNPQHLNGGVNHFGSPFNFPEEFVTVYRLHPLVPDLIEYREWNHDPNVVREELPLSSTFRAQATQAMHTHGLANMALSMGRQHRCDNSKVITHSQRMNDKPITDCLGHPDGTVVDNVEDVDVVVGWLSEFRHPHGYAISETQFVVFILNASRRLFSDRFFTSS